MAEFNQTQQALNAARAEQAAARRALFVATEKLRKLQTQRDEIKRRRSDATDAALAKLAKEERALTAAIDKLRARQGTVGATLADTLKQFEPFSDPVENLSRLDDRIPILLMPLRIETRFKQVALHGETRQQLWVRVYPDDIAVDTFEEVLADVEISNARIYWTNIWKAGGDDGEKRAAWQSLVKSHGAGRAYWIIQQVAPLNAADEPVKSTGELLLVIVTDNPLPAAEKPAVQDYWQRVFLAQNDQAELDAAYADLVTALGAGRAETIVRDYIPQNLATTASPAAVRVEFLEMPDPATIDSQQQPWMNAANTAVLPERLVVLGFNGTDQTLFQVGRSIPPTLSIGPNPTAAQEEQLRLEDSELVVPDALRWMTDFDQAVTNGMGFRIDLTPTQARAGFDRLFVLGVRMSADSEAGATQLENLIQNHQRSRKGFSLLPQGAPTNNVEDDVSGYTWREDTDLSYDHYFKQDTSDDPQDWRLMKDGRWLAESLGIDADILKASPNYYSTDQCEARAVNQAMWPATLGNFMEQMMEPVFSDGTIISTRAWFNRYVLGRGAIPAIRVGKQPYGILPVTPFSRMAWINRKFLSNKALLTGVPDQARFFPDAYVLIKKADVQWTELATRASYVGKPGADPQQALLDVVGLHPSSVEFYQRYAESAEQLYNRFKLSGGFAAFLAALIALGYVTSGMNLLQTLGHKPGDDGEVPEILNKLFLQAANLLKGPVIDDVPLSETDPIRAYRADDSNYLDWLIAASRDSHDTLRRQAGFLDDKPPTALLYLMLQHALDIGYVTTGIQLHLEANLLTQTQAKAARRDPKFIHIEEAQQDKGSPWQYLYKTEPVITNGARIPIGKFIPSILTTRNPYLNSQIQALECLRSAPTARLERAFAEHIDCCTHRLDAWWLGLLNVQLGLMRSMAPSGPNADAGTTGASVNSEEAGRGCYLGAYGWLEDLRPDHSTLAPVDLSEELDAIFNKPGQPPLVTDDQNFGYIHAPSLNHAVTAAVLRNGYLANATPANPESLAVNLTSERVRLAMGVIEGMRNGQSLSALLGYQLERGLHDQAGLFLDSVIYELRKQFPLMANRFSNTQVSGDTPIESIEARNVVDGLALVEHVQAQSGANRNYPFGLGAKLPTITDSAALAAINAQVNHIMDINDAVADVAMAESVYQVVRGNYDRAASTVDAYSKGNFPPTPEVVQTPRSGVTLTHRVGIHLPANLNPDDPANTTPQSKGEPSINAWLATKLPLMNTIYCKVDFFDHTLDADRIEEVTAAELGLLPIDLLYTVNRDGNQDLKVLDDLILRHVTTTYHPRPDADIRIRYRHREAGKYSFFEVSPLLADLHALLLRSRPLRSTDTRLPNEAQKAEEDTAVIRPAKVTRVRDLLDGHRAALALFVNNIGVLLDDPDEAVAADNAIDNIDTLIDDYSAIADDMSRFGLPGAGFGFAWEWRKRAFSGLATRLEGLVVRWTGRLAEFDQKLVDFPGLAPTMNNEEQIAWLLQAALLISTEVILPPTSGVPQDLIDTFSNTTRPAFNNALTDLSAILPAATDVSGLYRAMEVRSVSIALHDPEIFDLDANRTAIIAFGGTLRSKAQSLLIDIQNRLAAADVLILGDPADTSAKRVDALTEAIRKLTSADFVVLPEFTFGAEHAAEWQTAFNDRAQLLQYLRNDAGVDFPVDDWLYGVARVREKLHHFESATMFVEALSGGSLALEPVQFPVRADDAWLALRFPDKKPGTDEPFKIEEDKLLYTAHFGVPFDATAALHCGVLVDEWTEVIPRTEETTGIAFHYDRPNSEPPQTLLLALPANFTGSWVWQDLVDSLHETLEMSRKRAVEPRHVDDTVYARFLPATLSSVTRYPIFQMLNFAFNNAVQFSAD
jgi:hypothetical protein